VNWNAASEDSHTPTATNHLQVSGTFVYRMEAKDGSFGFDFSGVYDEIIPHERIVYTLEDGRKVSVTFTDDGQQTKVEETFEPETIHPVDM
jgi:uncharacterized protein YndB with AHSA1/START domain